MIRSVAQWANLLYLVAVGTALTVLAGLGDAPWRAHVNVAVVAGVAIVTPLLSVSAIRRKRWTGMSAAAVALNLLCLAYLIVRPEYAHSSIKVAALAAPLLNVVVLVADWNRRSAKVAV